MKPGRGRFEHARDHSSTRGANGGAPARPAGGWRFDPSRVDSPCAMTKGMSQNGDRTALIPRHHVVRLHDALPIRRVGQRQTASLTRRTPGDRVASSTVTEVEVDDTPGRGPGGSRFESGRSPHTAGDLVISEGPYPSPGGFDPRTRHPWAGGATGGAAPLQGEGCGFDPRTVHHADVAQHR